MPVNPPTAVTIPVVSSWAAGVTPIAAFDAALLAAGVGDVNLVALSSIVPPGHAPVMVHPELIGRYVNLVHGNLTHVVLAEQRARSGPVAAGLSWVNSPAGGLFLEGHGCDAEEVRAELAAGMEAMIKARPLMGLDPSAVETHVMASPIDVEGPSCAVVVAVFESRPFGQRV